MERDNLKGMETLVKKFHTSLSVSASGFKALKRVNSKN